MNELFKVNALIYDRAETVSRLEFAEINLLVTANREDDGLNLVKVHVVDGAHVPRKLVYQFATLYIPNVNIPEM